ncbi:MAG: glycosyltransferase [Gemmatimonadales bacterium]
MIYVLVPAHNEAPTVGLLLWKIRQLFTSFNREYHLIVVNDGSSDGSDDVLAPYTRALPLTLITHRQRRGYARSIEALLRESIRRTDRPRRDFAVTIQADFSESPDDLLELIKRLEGGADVVVPDRRRRVGAGRVERLARGALAKLVRGKLALEGAADVVGTMRGYRLMVIERLVREAGNSPILSREGWAADLELLARVSRHARRVESVVVTGERHESARPSRLRPLAEAWRALRASGALRGPLPAHPAHAENEESRVEDTPRPLDPVHARAGEEPRRGEHRHREHRQHEQRKHEHRHRHEGGQERRHRGQPHAAPNAPAQQTAAAPQDPAHPGDAAPQGAAPREGGSRRRRRRGRGRGRGPRPGQGPAQGPQQAPAPPPSAPPPAA